MPKSCETARAFINTGKLLGGDVGKALDSLKGEILTGMGGKGDAEKAKKADEELTNAGFTTSSLKELALCMDKPKKGVVAAAVDTSTLKGKLSDILPKVIETATGKAPDKKEEDGYTVITGDKDTFIAIKDNMIIQAATTDDLKAAEKASGEGAADFADAASNVIWVRAKGDEGDIAVNVKESGSDYDAKVVMPVPKGMEAEFKKDQDGTLKKFSEELNKQGSKMVEKPPFDVCAPVVKNMKVTADGGKLVISSTFPQAVLGDLAKQVGKDPKALLGGLMH